MNEIYGDYAPHPPELVDVILNVFTSANRHCPRCDGLIILSGQENIGLCGRCVIELDLPVGEDD